MENPSRLFVKINERRMRMRQTDRQTDKRNPAGELEERTVSIPS